MIYALGLFKYKASVSLDNKVLLITLIVVEVAVVFFWGILLPISIYVQSRDMELTSALSQLVIFAVRLRVMSLRAHAL